MSKSKRIKRRAVAITLFASARAMEVGVGELYQLLRQDNGEGHQKDSPLKGALTDKEYRLVEQRHKAGRKLIDDIRKIAQHLWKTSKSS